MGYAGASRRQFQGIPVASLRLLTEIHILLASGNLGIEQGNLEVAAANLPTVEDLLKNGIDCGALADPWNILGFQGQFPRSASLEDSIRDQRIDSLVSVMERTFNLHARLLSEGAARGDLPSAANVFKNMRPSCRLVGPFCHTTTVSDIPHVHGGDALASAEQVSQALGRWRERGSANADLGFWREHLDGFRSAKSFALVVDYLLRNQDYRASMSLLMTWLSQNQEVPLEDGDYSFHQAGPAAWMLGVCSLGAIEAASRSRSSSTIWKPTPKTWNRFPNWMFWEPGRKTPW